jgi:hypothetical protein
VGSRQKARSGSAPTASAPASRGPRVIRRPRARGAPPRSGSPPARPPARG